MMLYNLLYNNLLDHHLLYHLFNDLLFNMMLLTSLSKAASLLVGTIASRAAAQ